MLACSTRDLCYPSAARAVVVAVSAVVVLEVVVLCCVVDVCCDVLCGRGCSDPTIVMQAS